MEGVVSTFDLLIGTGGAGATALGAWIHMKTSVAALKIEIDHLKREIKEEKNNNKENHVDLSKKIDSIYKILTEIQISFASRK